ncbi:RagB/SusD family nutrient uptake outer membrane protein [Aliifodinibius sp. S!AR15-10]|uniref:RagB/SusD family nutrient uptake outer membrane protein n=1 Tax=Aliifodinibius sp. S!AR15-10 TaxID=2950437 RepID=UPI002865FA80|nr:RagB/SusD family nutrient uptake outer membrane protein [Aliifodinibius sp. S!AR15-10]MDR8391946.1 RagB/SusD family nutrient uptake outer membrane protein [Aliifodinibius sp. S!AR15-10]
MKKLHYIVVFVCLLLASGCSDFLLEDNKSSKTAENFYNIKRGYESLINSTYTTLREVRQSPYMYSAGTDLFFGSHQDAPQGLTTYQTLTPGSPQVSGFFQNLYESIQVANTALHYADKTEPFPELESRKGEARFLRAYYYFLLVQSFGDVTMVEKMVAEPITHFERTPASEVYQFIISELETAIEELPVTQSDYGRVTERAARHLLAKVYLTRGYEDYGESTDFENAASYADEAIGGEPLSMPYKDIFAYDNDANSEVIMSIQYDQESLVNGGRHSWDYPWGPLIQAQGEGVSKKNILHPTEHLFKLYGEYDDRFEGTFRNMHTSPYVGAVLNPENSPVEYYYPRTSEQLSDTTQWRAEDPENRNETDIVPIGPTWWDGDNQGSFPGLMKYDRIQTSDVNYTHDVFLARLGETYLIAAEAYFKMGDNATAADRINEVRRRAAMPGHESDMLISAGDVTIDFILDERARELAGEGFRWFDLKRTGKLMERTKEYNPQIRSLAESGSDPFLGAGGNYKILRPIPLSAISLDSGEYPQNPAYN